MKRTETRLENLERVLGKGEDVVVSKWEHETFVTFSLPVSKRGETMLFADFEKEFPDAKLVQLEWVDGEDWTNLR